LKSLTIYNKYLTMEMKYFPVYEKDI